MAYDPVIWCQRLEALLAELPDERTRHRARAAIHRTLLLSANPDGESLAVRSVEALLTERFPEMVWIVPEILPSGLALLAGRPKVGKSWLALQFAQAVVTGGVVLDQPVPQGSILYVALEDAPRRLQERMQKQGWPLDHSSHCITLGDFPGTLESGASEQLARLMEDCHYRLVVIDTFSRATRCDQNDVSAVTAVLAPLQEMAHQHNACVLLLDHHNKLASEDAIRDILGSTAKGAMCDTVMGLYRKYGETTARLVVIGRDIEERKFNLEFDCTLGFWQSCAEAIAAQLSQRDQEIVDVLQQLSMATAKQIAEAVRQDVSNTKRRLYNLVQAGALQRKPVGKTYVYYLPDGVD